MTKKKELVRICLWLPKIWVRGLDETAHRQGTSRTQIIKNLIIAENLRKKD